MDGLSSNGLVSPGELKGLDELESWSGRFPYSSQLIRLMQLSGSVILLIDRMALVRREARLALKCWSSMSRYNRRID